MDKLPTNLFVGIVAGLTGAGMMWLCVGGWKEPGQVSTAEPQGEEPARASRIGTVEPYRPDAELEIAGEGAMRVDQKAPGGFAGQPAVGARLSQKVSKVPDVAPDRIAAVASFYRSPSLPADPLPMRGRPAFVTANADSESVKDALIAALEAAAPYEESGFTVREEYWGGVMDGSPRAITHQLFGGNEYWFWAGTDIANSGIDVHVYDSEGNLAESEHWKRKGVAAARVTAARTGTYYLVISDQRTSDPRRPRKVHWAVAYGFR